MSVDHPSTTPIPGAGPDAAPVEAAPPVSSGTTPDQEKAAPASARPRPAVRGTRTGRVWVGVCAAALITVALIVFMVQNTHTVRVNFLGLTGSTSLALMLLIAAVGGILLTLILGSARILQLRHTVRRPR